MNKLFTEMPAQPKERLIISVYFTKDRDPSSCEICHRSRVSFAEKQGPPPMCDVCGRFLCRNCFGSEETVPGPDLRQYHCCDSCIELERVEIEAILDLRAKLNRS